MTSNACSAGLQACVSSEPKGSHYIWRVCLLVLSTVTASAQTTTFSSKVEAVRVDVLVTEKGRPVRGLQPADFELFDNGVRQEVDFASFEQIPLNVVLALDMSESVVGARLDNLKRAARALLDGLRRDDQAALVTFSHIVIQGAGLTTDLDRVRQALDRSLEPGHTSLVDGVFTAMMIGEGDVGRALVIVFSDGADTMSWLPSELVLDAAKRSDDVVYAVQAGRVRAPFLHDLSEATGGALLQADPSKDLSATFLAILEEFRQRYLVSYTPRGVAPGGWHRLDVRVRGRSVSVKARPGYLAN